MFIMISRFVSPILTALYEFVLLFLLLGHQPKGIQDINNIFLVNERSESIKFHQFIHITRNALMF